MLDWFATLGNGTGLFMVFNPPQIDGSIYTEEYVAALAHYKDSGQPNIVQSLARNQKIYNNSNANIDFFYKLLKHGIRKDGVDSFAFTQSFYYNSSLTQGAALDLLVADTSITNLITHAETTQLTAEDATFLNEII